MNKKERINYIFILLFFVITLFFYSYQIISLNKILSFSKIYLLTAGLIQILIEIGIFCVCGWIIKRVFPGWVYRLFTGAFFCLFLYHVGDFIVLRLMDQSMGSALDIYKTLDITHILSAFYSMNMNRLLLSIIISSCLLAPAIGLFAYYLLEKITNVKPIHVSFKMRCISIVSLCLILVVLDLAFLPHLEKKQIPQGKKLLPFGSTLLKPQYPIYSFKLKKDPVFQPDLISYDSDNKLPNIYLFVIETFRKDFLTKEITPFLHTFKTEYIDIENTFSNANTTFLSWYSIFSSQFTYKWKSTKEEEKGTIPLQILKQAGYNIHMYASADLRYFRTNEKIFGKGYNLCNKVCEFNSLQLPDWQKDKKTIEAFKQDLENHKSNTVFVIFLDSPHSEYSYPNSLEGKFGKTIKNINYLHPKIEKDIPYMINRYKTSLCYIDSQIKDALEEIKSHDLFEEAVITITGDHGEEFMEEGSIFHGTHLNKYQLEVPLLFKMGKNNKANCSIASHIDIFPSLLTHLNITYPSTIFDGQAIQIKKSWPFVLSVQKNGHSSPVLFSITDGKKRLHAEIVSDQKIELHSMQDEKLLKALAF